MQMYRQGGSNALKSINLILRKSSKHPIQNVSFPKILLQLVQISTHTAKSFLEILESNCSRKMLLIRITCVLHSGNNFVSEVPCVSFLPMPPTFHKLQISLLFHPGTLYIVPRHFNFSISHKVFLSTTV